VKKVMLVGIDIKTKEELVALLKHVEIFSLKTYTEKLDPPVSYLVDLIICGPPQDSTPLQMGQFLRMKNASTPMLYIYRDRKTLKCDRSELIQNGFTGAFLLPLERGTLESKILELLSSPDLPIKQYHPVKLIDLEVGTKYNFDIFLYLPLNNKYVLLCRAETPLDSDRIDQLKSKDVSSIYLRTQELQKFYDYIGEKLRSLGQTRSEFYTETRDKIRNAVRILLNDLFEVSLAPGNRSAQESLKHLQEIIKSYAMSTASGHMYERFLVFTSDKTDSYSHSANVSTFAALFSLGLGIGMPEELAAAGLLHDIGLIDIPEEIITKSEEKMTTAELRIMASHPELTLDILKKKKLQVSDMISKMILQHHERHSGKGYPKQLKGEQITAEATVLALADRLDDLTCIGPWKKVHSLKEAVWALEQSGEFSTEFLNKVLELFNCEGRRN